MKNLTKLSYLAFSLAFILSACSTDDDDHDHVHCSVDAPATYAFEHDGQSTVYYGGQTNRLLTAKDLYDLLNANTATDTAALMALWRTNNLNGKTAENSDYEIQVVDDVIDILVTYADNSAVFEDAGNGSASPGVAGKDNDGNSLDENGWEGDQQFAKMLIGALCLEQVNYDYLTKMNVDNTDRTYSNFNDDGTPNGNSNVYTKREHYYDEAFGYVYGLDEDVDPSNGIDNKLLLGKYLIKHDGSGEYSGNNWSGDAINAFITGRQAVVEDCQEVLDEQIVIINETLSKVVAWHAQDYLTQAADKKENV